MGPAESRILVIEDDAEIRALLRTLLERAGMQVVEAPDGESGLRTFFETRPELVLLDLSLPRMDGFETLGRIRQLSDVPVLVLTARSSEGDKVLGLRSGADDYLTKPFGRQELVARAEALLRRHRKNGAGAPRVVSDAIVTIDAAQASVAVNGMAVALTPLEFKLLGAFVRHPSQVLSQDQLLDLVWGASGTSRDQVKLYVGYLRKKLRDVAGVEPIETVRGFGYRYRPEPDGQPVQSQEP
jgi:DNA-binding response OmpR family regulator